MRWIWRLVGVVACAMGVIWILQGLGYIPGSFMSGQTFWAWMGLVAVVVGAGAIVLSGRGR